MVWGCSLFMVEWLLLGLLWCFSDSFDFGCIVCIRRMFLGVWLVLIVTLVGLL